MKTHEHAAQLAEALDPFKRLAALLEPLGLDDDTPIRDCAPGVWPTLGDCRKACLALASWDKHNAPAPKQEALL